MVGIKHTLSSVSIFKSIAIDSMALEACAKEESSFNFKTNMIKVPARWNYRLWVWLPCFGVTADRWDTWCNNTNIYASNLCMTLLSSDIDLTKNTNNTMRWSPKTILQLQLQAAFEISKCAKYKLLVCLGTRNSWLHQSIQLALPGQPCEIAWLLSSVQQYFFLNSLSSLNH